ncbi:ATP-binding cassette domain-containing protein [Oricola cellulosilytica]|uniref:ATP-binding cassette domain-containing protein n=1 Tax=Oricola cellulosilytica TaxID=1429082 RepID=A0A4R0PHG9_9HYPH|nr:ATP-binding cassette domain-containing protein [Oricola cellulosilytica]TCD16293.1 ATP-binding cassette domain-containing protein [Oricola cellulosilytica]
MPENSSPGLRLEKVRIGLNSRTLLSVDHHVGPADTLTIMGPSGSGKSTLLAYIGGFLDQDFVGEGRVICGGRDITILPAQERHAGILFQDPLLFPHMSVGGNLVFALPASVTTVRERRTRAEAALEDVGLGGLFDRDPETLSGGQKARVALARVLISEPNFLLLDEPFSKLDMQLRDQIRTLVFEQASRTRLPVILVTHDESDARAARGDVIEVGA